MKRSGLSVVALGLASGPARAECFNCYDGLLMMAVLAILLIIATLVGFWWMLRTGRAWVLGWLVAAVALYAVGAWGFSRGWQTWMRWQMESRETLNDLPVMSERTPLLLYGGALSGRYAMGCQYTVGLFRKTQGVRGFLAVTMDDLETWSTGEPIPLAQIPMEFHTVTPEQGAGVQNGEAGPVALGSTDKEIASRFVELADVSDYDNDRFQAVPLSSEERVMAAARIDYVVIAPCSSWQEIQSPLRRNPALEGLRADVDISLAMAPLEKGLGTLALETLEFDLLDLSWDHLSMGFPPHLAIGVWSANSSVGLGALARSFCAEADGQRSPEC